MEEIELRKLGKITELGEKYLAELISLTCSRDELKYQVSLWSKENLGWVNGRLIPYVLADLMPEQSSRFADNHGNYYLSSGEWLCSIFTSGKLLNLEHIITVMSFINPKISIPFDTYHSGKNIWEDAPSPIKEILNILDEACSKGNKVSVSCPRVEITGKTVEECEKITDMEELKLYCKVIWD
jgi:ArsR family metal-binding transcriptional regulator